MTEPRFVPAVDADTIADKSFACLEVEGRGLVICRFRDEYYALENQCSHALSTFDGGRMRGPRIMCPLHGATFDVRDGSCVGPPATRPIRAYATRVREGMVEIAIED